jgi:Xaa-Pro aminopeptidase
MAEATGTTTSRTADLTHKLARLCGAVAGHDVHTIVIGQPANLAWLLECRLHVPQTLDSACLSAVVETGPGGPRVRIVTNTIEAPRLRDTELADIDVDWEVLPWWQSRADGLPRGRSVGRDASGPGWTDLSDTILDVRRQLTDRQQALLAAVCADTAEATTEVGAAAEPTMTETAVAARLAAALLARELDPIVLMVGGGDRPKRHRHPLPTTEPLAHRGTLVCCARRHGVVASCSRIVAFGPLSVEDRDRYDALVEVERAFLDATMPGRRLGEVVDRGVAAYAAQDFAPDEWHRHHQGGLTGFQPREFPADPGSQVMLRSGMAVAWNPTGAGWKVEDTCVVTEGGVRTLMHDDGWPTLSVGGRARPDVWIR